MGTEIFFDKIIGFTENDSRSDKAGPGVRRFSSYAKHRAILRAAAETAVLPAPGKKTEEGGALPQRV
jgi:hypothetical protein